MLQAGMYHSVAVQSGPIYGTVLNLGLTVPDNLYK